jgi:RNA polymerase sigma-70 factor (ECF subfamily)
MRSGNDTVAPSQEPERVLRQRVTGRRRNAASLCGEQPRAIASPMRLSPQDRSSPRVLDPEALSRHIDQLYRAAWALCGSRHDAEDLVQETFLNVLKRPRVLRNGNEIGYLLRAMRNTYSSRYRSTAHRRRDRALNEDDATSSVDRGVETREIMEAIASAPAAYRDAVVAVDVIGLSYREAARALGTRESTITTRLHRGRQHVARALEGEPAPAADPRRLAA